MAPSLLAPQAPPPPVNRAPVTVPRSLRVGTVVSVALHVILVGALYGLLAERMTNPVPVELDLSQAPLVPTPVARHAPAVIARQKAWTTPVSGLAPAPTGATESPEPEAVVPTCPPPCPDTPGAFVPAGMASAKPRWISGLISDDDYPKIAQRQGQDGLVTLSVFIDAQGRVRDVRLLKGSYDVLNRVALEKLKLARFEPARDATGTPIPVKLVLPIRFELK